MIKKILILLAIVVLVGVAANAYFTHRAEERRAAQLRIQQAQNRERSITIIEGWRLEDIADDLAKEGVADKNDFLAAAKIGAWRDKYEFLQDAKIKSLEGFLFPDTYKIFITATSQDIIKKLLDEFDSKVTPQMRSDLKAQNRSLADAVILASIIEREISNQPEFDSDRKIAAGIFLNRLQINMGLQSDATVNYITGKTTTRPTLKDIGIDSPYNTYKYRGLPPGPINNPSLASLLASIYPTPTDYLYFITDASGQAHFAKTLAEHQQNIAKYLEN